jgi:hypothetical protein
VLSLIDLILGGVEGNLHLLFNYCSYENKKQGTTASLCLFPAMQRHQRAEKRQDTGLYEHHEYRTAQNHQEKPLLSQQTIYVPNFLLSVHISK